MSPSPPSTSRLVATIVAVLSISPGWCEDLTDRGSLESVPEPATSLLGLLGLCLILLRRTKP